MRFLLKTMLIIISALVIIIFHLTVVYLFPSSWSKINVIFLFLLLYLVWSGNSQAVWLTALTHLFLEFLSLTPFGLLLFSSVLSMLFSYWLFHSLFINHSWYTAMVLTAGTLFFFRIFYLLGLILFDPELQLNSNFWLNFTQSVAWEIGLTTLTMGLVYLLAAKFSRRFNPSLIH